MWLGLTVGCAQCHDHKYDPITQKDLYSLTAFFDNVEEVDIDAPRPGEAGPWLAKAAEYRAKREALLKDYNVAALQREWEGWMRFAIENPGKKTDLDLAWDCVLKLTEGGDGGKILQTPPAKRTEREQDILTDHFIRNYHFAVGGHRYEQTNFRQLDAKLRKLKEDSYPLTQAMVVAEEGTTRKTHIKIRGDWKADGPEVAPVTPAVLPPLRSEGRASRLDLARWLVSRENPLTARVTVNRIWQELFGVGLVRTAEDFGTRSERPLHPELLDWLAGEFMDNGWSRKQLIRTIVTSAVYRQSSQVSPALFQKDPLNTLLARQSRLRLPAELLRDSALAVGGLLSPKVGGPSIRPPQPNGVMELGYGQKVGANWDDSKGEDRYRRGLYVQFLRTTPYPLLVNFDAPKGNVAACRRERSNTPLQALNLLNDPVFFEAAQGFAQRILGQPAHGFRERLEFAFETALGRGPSAAESTRLQAYLEKQTAILEREKDSAAKIAPWAASPQEGAAWTALASVVLNLDEFITRE
ncbi:MAG: DUF1549 and DUF1553 domain-containing protein [Bryobacter sp.]|nr:DUF1549 and DUF1553 domain-containing protein [Bryobacter sp.]